MNKHYGGVIWTDHAIERLRTRKIKQGDAWATFRRPDSSKNGKKQGVVVYYKTWPLTNTPQHKLVIEVVATKNDRNEWVILSVWSRKVKVNQRPKTQKTRLLISRIMDIFRKG
ncbi:hypothetical protein IPM62_05805 [Candidatus Woesebacteria bacterium]|nr:MAG: hypothetical protein IPM62_05805 [Candidatus Woesebacteria bacterium]